MSSSARDQVRQDEPIQPQSDVRVLFIEQVADRLGMSVRTIQRRIRAGAFPIPELQRLDIKRRWSSVDVEHWIATSATEQKSRLRVVRSK